MKYVVLLFAFAAMYCSSHQLHAQALWEVKSEDGEKTLYLFGTMHILDSAQIPMDEIVYAKLRESDSVYMELAIADKEAFNDPSVIMKHAVANTPLKERISAEAYEKVQKFLETNAVAAMMKDVVDTWMLALTITSLNMLEQGFSPELGAENQLQLAIENTEIEIQGLETVVYQISLFDNLPQEVQEEFLLSAISEDAISTDHSTTMATMWRKGDIDGLAEFMATEFVDYPELEKVLLTDRNIAWMQRIREMLLVPGDTFIAVGAGHLVGEGGIVAMLTNEGYSVKRIN